MEMWFSARLARMITEERLRGQRREPTVLDSINFNWLQPMVKNLIGIFL
ncbi:MAG: hypothetical protein ACP5J4_08115 [Anaerolineae bacterium]